MLEPAVTREEGTRGTWRDDGLHVEGRPKEWRVVKVRRGPERIGPTAWGNLINVNAAATAGATRRVWQSLICNSTLSPSAFSSSTSTFSSYCSPFHWPFHPLPPPIVGHPRSPTTPSATPGTLYPSSDTASSQAYLLSRASVRAASWGLLNIWERGKGFDCAAIDGS